MRRWCLVALAAALGACATASEPVPEAAEPATARVLVMTAMPIELEPLLAAADVGKTVTLNGRTHHLGSLEGVPVVLTSFGISMVNASMGAQVALSEFEISAIIVSGIAGGASPEIRIGDVSVPARWSQYQEHVFTDASRTGWRRGWRNEELGSFGMMYPQRVWATRPEGAADAEHLKLWFDVDPELLAGVESVSETLALKRCNEAGDCVEHEPTVLVGGNGVSGPTFVDDADYRDWVWEAFEPDAFDMETAAIGHVAYANGVPFIGIRSISDMAGANPKENRVESFAPIASGNAAAVTRALLRTLATGR